MRPGDAESVDTPTHRRQQYSDIQTLRLNNNRLTTLPPQLAQLWNLRVLDVQHNQLTALPMFLGRMWCLETVRTRGNALLGSAGHPGSLVAVRSAQPPPPQLPPRQWLARPNSPQPGGTDAFTVCNFNILAPTYASRQMYPYCPPGALKWETRARTIVSEIVAQQPAVVCLQEVRAMDWEIDLLPALARRGYDGVLKQKSRVFTADQPGAVDGCAIAWHRDRFQPDGEPVYLDFRSMSLARDDLRRSKDVRAIDRISGKDNICLLQPLREIGGRRKLMVANLHAQWDPALADVKLMQVQLMVERVAEEMAPGSALVICGDFNSKPDSSVYELMRNGATRGEDLGEYKYGPYARVGDDKPAAASGLVHDLDLESSYLRVTGVEPEYTNLTALFKGTLDYIWYSQRTLDAHSVLQPLRADAWNTPLPSPQNPSDHVSLFSRLSFTRPPVSQDPQMGMGAVVFPHKASPSPRKGRGSQRRGSHSRRR